MRIAFASLVLVAAAACGGADEAPLGGPYGGTSGSTSATNGNSSTGNGGDDGGTTSTGDDSTGGGGGDSGGGGGSDSGGGGGQPDAGGGGGGPDASTGGGGVDSGGGGGGVDSGQQQSSAPTWSMLFASYLASGTDGDCKGCHSEGSSASALYSWLNGRGYMTAPNPTLLSNAKDGLTWYGGGMPRNGAPANAQAVTDFNAWAAAGAQNN